MFAWLKNFFAGFSGNTYAPHIDPPIYPCGGRDEAFARAHALAGQVFGGVEITSGTPSMVPLIPAAPTYLAVRPLAIEQARLGSVVSYRAPWLNNQSVTHRLVAKDKGGFIPSGDNNARSEPDIRVTAANLIGEVVGIFTFPKTASIA